MNAVVDTNILIDYLCGIKKAKEELAQYKEITISLISWMEVLVGAKDDLEAQTIKEFLRSFSIRQIDLKIAELAISIRKESKIRLPDAIIWATAQEEGTILVTRNSKDFPRDNPGIRIPYKV